MRVRADILGPDGHRYVLGPGDIVGRAHSAALVVDDARVSEAHALLSLRGGALHLLALRGMLAVDGATSHDVELEPDLEVELAPGVALCIEALTLPAEVLALEAPGLGRQVLTGTCSVVTAPALALVGRYREDAAAHLWSRGDGWRLQLRGQPARDLTPGEGFEVGGVTVRAVAVALDHAAQTVTRVDGGLAARLHVVAQLDTVHLHRAGEPPLVLDGISARIVSELVALGGPVPWEVLAGEVWNDGADRDTLRRRLDVSLVRLRHKLRRARVRADLVRAGGTGQIELLRYPGDRIDDRT